MDDKILDLLEKVYIELQSTKTELKGDINGLKDDVANIDRRLTKLETRIENDVTNKLDLLYESQVDTNKRIEIIDKKIDELNHKVNQHDLKIKVIESGRRKRTI